MAMVEPTGSTEAQSSSASSGSTPEAVTAVIPSLDFRDAFLIELKSIQKRRDAFLKPRDKDSSGPAGPPPAPPLTELKIERGPSDRHRLIEEIELALVGGWGVEDKDPKDILWRSQVDSPIDRSPYEEGDPVKDADALNLTGLCLSGGGIRSAAISLGVLQGIDALTPAGDSSVINRLDYVSGVSGGNYMATSVLAGMMQPKPGAKPQEQWPPSFPYESKTDGSETPETQHLRNYSSFLVPFGAVDYASNLLVVLRGLVVNALMIAPALLAASALLLIMHPTVPAPGQPVGPWWPLSLLGGVWPQVLGPFVIAPLLALVLAVRLIWPVLWEAKDEKPPTLTELESRGHRIAWLGFALAIVTALEAQAYVLQAMTPAPSPSQFDGNIAAFISALMSLFGFAASPPPPRPDPTIASGIAAVTSYFGAAGPLFASLTLTLALFAQKLITVIKATVAAETYAALIKRVLALGALLALGLSLPLLLYIACLNLTFWGLDGGQKAPGFIKSSVGVLTKVIPFPDDLLGGPVALLWIILGLILLALAWATTPNGNSLHRLYRDRLSRAFLIERAPLWAATDAGPSGNKASVAGREDANNWPFSSLKKPRGPNDPFDGAAASPYLLVNTAVNLRSPYLNRRGRKADVFTLGPLTSGSDVTRYAKTKDLERRDANLSLAGGLAISGAAASANMGSRTISVLTFTLAALNVRLGYWLPNPRRLKEIPLDVPADQRLNDGNGLSWFWRELFGRVDSDSERVHLTDGGHIENLGLYPLLKRRCRVIIAVDAEEDQSLVFPSLVRAQLMTRVDHGVRIELPWPAVAADAKAAAKGLTQEDFKPHQGPHVAIGRIIYRQKDPANSNSRDVHGVLIYIKSSLSGDENDLVRDYHRRHPTFPHETTINQFFSEEQFEAYRALGFHMTRGFFTGRDEAAVFDPGKGGRTDFLTDVRSALSAIGVPPPSIDAVISRIRKGYEEADRKPAPPPKADLGLALATALRPRRWPYSRA